MRFTAIQQHIRKKAVGVGAAGTNGERFMRDRQRLVKPALQQPNIAENRVRLPVGVLHGGRAFGPNSRLLARLRSGSAAQPRVDSNHRHKAIQVGAERRSRRKLRQRE